MSALEVVAPPSYDDFVRAHTPRLQRLASRRLADRGEAEEVVQETLLRLHEHWDEFASEASAAAWTTTVASRLVVDRLRVAGRSVPVPDIAEGVRVSRDTADVVVARQEARVALDALEALPPRQAAVLWAREVEGLSYDAIAERHGLTEPSVRSLLLRGRKGLRLEYARRGGTAPAGLLGALGAVVPLSPALDALRALGRLRRAAATTIASSAAGLAVVAVAVLVAPSSSAPSPAAPALRTAAPAATAVGSAPPAAATSAQPVRPAEVPARVPSDDAAQPVGAGGTAAGAPVRLPGACVAVACLDGTVTEEDREDPLLLVPVPDNPLGVEDVGVSVDPLADSLPTPLGDLLPAHPVLEDPSR